MVKTIYIRIGETVSTRYEPQPLYLGVTQYMNLAVIAQPRYGKGGVIKPVVVKLSKHRPILVFDFKGEWVSHITQPNYKSAHPDFVAQYKAFQNFTFHLRDFQHTQDWISMGFGNGAEQLKNLFIDTYKIHKGIPDRFLQVIMDLPTREAGIDEFNAKYGPILRGAFNWMYVQDYRNYLPHRLRWFWQGPHDKRQIYNFTEEWMQHKNIFIDFSSGDDGDIDSKYHHQTFFGKIMEQMQPSFHKIQGMIVIEEADVLLPNPRAGARPSSNVQMMHFSAKAPKTGMGCILIMQNREQTDPLIFRGGQWQWLIGLFEGYPKPFKGLPHLNGETREFILLNTYRRWWKFIPDVPCCKYESNLSGGMII